MQDVKFDPTNAEAENQTAGEVLGKVRDFVKPINALTNELNDEGAKLTEIRDKLKDLRNQSDYSMDTARQAIEIMDKIKCGKHIEDKKFILNLLYSHLLIYVF